MSFHKSRFAKISAISLAVLAFLMLISLIVVSKVILPREIRTYIEGIFKNKGYKIEIKEIEFDFFSGLKAEEIEIFDTLSPRNPLLRVEKVAAKPEILSSLINRKIRVRGIIVDKPVFSFTKKELDSLMKLIKEEEIERKERKPLLIEVEHLEITDVQVEVASGVLLRSKKIEVDFGDAKLKEEKTVNLSGLINLQNNEIEIHGRIKPFLDTPVGELRINLPELNTGLFSTIVQPPAKLSIFSEVSFQISDKIISRGIVNFGPARANSEEASPFSGKLEYDLIYDESSDTALLNSLNLNIDKLVSISFAGCIEKLKREAIFNLEGKAEHIRLEKLEGILKWFPNLSRIKFSGDVEPSDIKVIGSRRNKDVSLSGRIILSGVNINDEKNGLKISGLEGRFDFKKTFGLRRNALPAILHSQNRAFGGFSTQGDFSLRSVWTKTLEINKFSGKIEFVAGEGWNDWTLNISPTDSQFRISDEEIYLKQFKADIRKGGNGRRDIWGSISGKEARYKKASFTNLSTDFEFSKALLKLTNLKMQIGSYGELKTKELNFLFGNQENGTSYALTFAQGSFSGFNRGVKSRGIKGEFFYARNREKPTWDGSMFINEVDIFKSQLKNLSLRINLSSEGINLERISGRFLGGNLGGSVWVKTKESPYLIFSDLEFRKIVLPSNKFPVSLGRLNLEFQGELMKGLLPQGMGKVELSDLKVGGEITTYPLSAQIELQTIGETLILKQGFIENEEGVRIDLTGRMENSLNGNRSLQLDLPQIPLVFAQKTLSNVLPQVLRDGEFRGNAGLALVFNHFLHQENSWNGKLSIKDVSFSGRLHGTHFFINGVNGTIPLKDKSKPENLLASLMGKHLKLDKRVFKGFLDAVTQDDAEKEEDFLELKEIEYGFLRLEDIEFAVELDRNKLNLKRFESKLYGGDVFGTGLFEFSGAERKYSLSLLFKDISLKSISNSIPPIKDYITGRMNGIAWLSGEGKKLDTLDGPFNFWSIESRKESRRIGKAFLKKLGAKARFFLRSSRKYDKGEISGYVKDGVITFKELHISHSTLGIRDLLVQVDPKRNSISVAHFLLVIREIAKRSSAGKLKIEFENK